MMEMFFVGSEANLAIAIDPRHEKYHTFGAVAQVYRMMLQFLY
jgi:hypothetical protein